MTADRGVLRDRSSCCFFFFWGGGYLPLEHCEWTHINYQLEHLKNVLLFIILSNIIFLNDLIVIDNLERSEC